MKKYFEFLLKNSNKEKLNLILDKYSFATSALQIPDKNRFIDLMTILEMLYLTKDENFGNGRKLKGRIHKILGEDEESIQYLYDIRSSIVHSGESNIELKEDDFIPDGFEIDTINKIKKSILHKKFQERLKNLSNIVRKSLLLYLDELDKEKDSKYTEENLKLICNPQKTKCKDKKDILCKDCNCEVEL